MSRPSWPAELAELAEPNVLADPTETAQLEELPEPSWPSRPTELAEPIMPAEPSERPIPLSLLSWLNRLSQLLSQPMRRLSNVLSEHG